MSTPHAYPAIYGGNKLHRRLAAHKAFSCDSHPVEYCTYMYVAELPLVIVLCPGILSGLSRQYGVEFAEISGRLHRGMVLTGVVQLITSKMRTA